MVPRHPKRHSFDPSHANPGIYIRALLLPLPVWKKNSSHISGKQSSTTKRPRFSQPGTLTVAEILGQPSRPLRWLSLSTPRTFRPSQQGSSFSHRNARSNLPSPPPEPPSVRTAGDTDTPINDAPPPTPRAPFVRFTILAQLTDARIQPAPAAGTIRQSLAVVRPRPPIAVTAVVTTLPHSENVRLDLSRLSPPEPTLQPQPRPVKTPWIWRSMPVRHPLLPRPGRVPLRWT